MAVSRPSLATFPALRAWQRRALVEYLRRREEDFLAVATPGAGKTTFRPPDRGRAALGRHGRGTHGGDAHRAPEEPVGGRGPPRWASSWTPPSATRNIHSTSDFHGAVITYARSAWPRWCNRPGPWPDRPWSSWTRSITPATHGPGATASSRPSSPPYVVSCSPVRRFAPMRTRSRS